MHGETVKFKLYEVRTTTKSPNVAYLYPRRYAMHICTVYRRCSYHGAHIICDVGG